MLPGHIQELLKALSWMVIEMVAQLEYNAGTSHRCENGTVLKPRKNVQQTTHRTITICIDVQPRGRPAPA